MSASELDTLTRRPFLWRFRGQTRPQRKAVIDIGSNSVRLIVYQVRGRSTVPQVNEKVMAGLGRDVLKTGCLHPEGRKSAFAALGRFTTICTSLGVSDVTAIATSAVREASDGPDFCREVETTWGLSIKVLTGEDEARYAALGVVSAQRNPTGLIGDLGGSSLELISVKDGVLGKGHSFQAGPLALLEVNGGKPGGVQDYLDQTLKGLKKAPAIEQFYGVGGAWRAIAKVHMEARGYPLRVLQSYAIPADEMLDLCDRIIRQDGNIAPIVRDIAGKRAKTLHLTAMSLSTVLKNSRAKEMIISAYGVREGLLYGSMSEEVQAIDPLMAGMMALSKTDGGQAAFARALETFAEPVLSQLEPVFDGEDQRYHSAATLISDIGATLHPDHRADIAQQLVLRGPYTGVSHAGRIYLGLITAFRYQRKFKVTDLEKLTLSEAQIERAQVFASLVRLAAEFSARTERILKKASLKLDDTHLILKVHPKASGLVSDGVQRRLAHAASQLKRESRIDL